LKGKRILFDLQIVLSVNGDFSICRILIFCKGDFFMSDKHESMNGIIKLYDLRREPVMREARTWFDGFHADSFEDIIDLFKTEDERYFRMVLTYWEMAASFVNHGAIDEQMFNETTVEHLAVFSKAEPFIEDLRGMTKIPDLLTNLEKLVLRIPNVKETLANFRERAKERSAVREKAATAA
jgi:hypothetical protein